jgi:L-fucose isomerase-like protein
MAGVKIGIASVVQPSFWGSSQDLYRTRYLPEMEILAKKMDFELLVWRPDIVTEKDGKAACDFMNAEDADFILLQCTTFPGGGVILPFARAHASLGLWAVGEGVTDGAIPLNSFCGLNMLASILGQYIDPKRPVKWFYGEADSELFLERFRTSVGALRGIKKLRGARTALIGGIAPGFTDMAFDERTTMARLGAVVDRLPEYGDIKDMANSYSQEEISPVIEEFAADAASVNCGGDMEATARLYKAFEDFITGNNYDAVAIGCWPKYRRDFGVVVCGIIGRLLEKGFIAACEGDVDSMLSMLMLKGVSGGDMPMLMDLSDLDFSDNSVMLWHCGSAPRRFSDPAGMSLNCHYKPGRHVPAADATPVGAVNDMYFRSVPATIARFTWEYRHMLLLTGDFFDKGQNRGFDGSRGWMNNLRLAGKPVDVPELMNTILTARFQHHYPVIAGSYQNEVMEAMAWLGVAPLEAVKYEPYLQIFSPEKNSRHIF